MALKAFSRMSDSRLRSSQRNVLCSSSRAAHRNNGTEQRCKCRTMIRFENKGLNKGLRPFTFAAYRGNENGEPRTVSIVLNGVAALMVLIREQHQDMLAIGNGNLRHLPVSRSMLPVEERTDERRQRRQRYCVKRRMTWVNHCQTLHMACSIKGITNCADARPRDTTSWREQLSSGDGRCIAMIKGRLRRCQLFPSNIS